MTTIYIEDLHNAMAVATPNLVVVSLDATKLGKPERKWTPIAHKYVSVENDSVEILIEQDEPIFYPAGTQLRVLEAHMDGDELVCWFYLDIDYAEKNARLLLRAYRRLKREISKA